MKAVTLFYIIWFIFFYTAQAQHPNVMIAGVGWPEEPSIYMDPTNTDHLIAGANIDMYFYSNDGGWTWESGTLTSTYGVWGDPCVIVDTAGDYYFFHLSDPPGGNWIDRIVCQKSTDNGMTWNQGSYMGLNGTKAQDKHWAVVDRTNNNIYVTWTQFDDYGSANPSDSSIILFSKSTNGGLSWSTPFRLSEKAGDCLDGDNTTEGAVPAVGPNDEIYVAWACGENIYFDQSYDGGITWLDHDINVTDMPGGWDLTVSGISRCNGMPVMVCDLSQGPNRGTLYVNWADTRNGETDVDIWLSKSTDGGQTWSPPIRVNNDPPGKQQFFTWMAIDQSNGYLYFVFYDRRYYDNNLTDVYMASSVDGGESFFNFKVSESPFLPWSNIFFGDYNNITAHNNVVRPIWTRLDEGVLSIWTAIINPDYIGTEEYTETMPFSLEQNFPNPFAQTTYFAFKLEIPSIISLKIYDVFGCEAGTLLNGAYKDKGKYIEHFDPAGYNLSPGVYIFELSSENTILRRKMIYVK
jgi:hypothetical protein